ncbi:MAG: MBL fold metallo-hydrolase [Thermoplasmata archaeon]
MASIATSDSGGRRRVPGPAEKGVALEHVAIAEGIHQFITAPDGYVPNGNSVVVVNDHDVLVFDTFTRPSTARKLLAEIRAITDKPVRYVVNSHWHPDHWSGNEVFADEFPDLEIVATEETRRYMVNFASAWPTFWSEGLRRAEDEQFKEVTAAQGGNANAAIPENLQRDAEELRKRRDFVSEAVQVKRTYPTLTYRGQLTLHHGGREFRLISMVGDANGTSVLYLPREKILATGDVLSHPVPYFSPPLSEHARSLRVLGQMDADVVIPGHGPAWRDKDFLNLVAELFESLVRQAGKAVQNGLVTAEEVQKAVDVESLRLRFTHGDPELDGKFRRYVLRMIENATREARDGRELGY